MLSEEETQLVVFGIADDFLMLNLLVNAL